MQERPIEAVFVVGEPLCDIRTPSLSPNKFTQGQQLMKLKWLVANVTAVRSPDRTEHAIQEVIFRGFFQPNQAVFVPGEPLCDVGTPS